MSELDDDRTLLEVCPAPEVYRKKIWKTAELALHFLIFLEIALMPGKCHLCGAKWNTCCRNGHASMKCAVRVLALDGDREEGVMRQCGGSTTWRTSNSFMTRIPNSVNPQGLCRTIYWFRQKCPAEQLTQYSGLCEKTCRKVVNELRRTLTNFMLKETQDTQLGALPGTAVCLDETFFTNKKRNRGGFQGRSTQGTQTIIFAGTEITNTDERPRRGIGKSFLVVVPNRRRETLEQIIRARVAPGATVWTDGHASYKWMGEGVEQGELSPAGFRWSKVVHADGEFVRGEVSTNAVEGLFSRLKKFLRESKVTHVSKEAYGIYLGEFLWREKFLSQRALGHGVWRHAAFWKLCDVIASENKPEVNEEWMLANETVSKFRNMQGDLLPVAPAQAFPVPSA
jgi:transposase-like protein